MKKIYLLFLLSIFFNQAYSQVCDSVTLNSISDPGPYTFATLTEADGLRNGPDYNGATIYYPENATAPFACIVIVPGFLSFQSSIADWGPFYASHGIVAMTIGTNSIFDQPGARANGLIDALETLREENTRADSPLFGNIDVNRFAVSGWSMGGGGSQLAAKMDPNLKAVVTMCPWLSNPSATDLDHAIPVLFFAGENDPTAPPTSHADVHYDLTPATTDKLKFEIANGDHNVANGPNGGNGDVGKIAISWLKTHLLDEDCYCSIMEDTPATASQYATNIVCEMVPTALADPKPKVITKLYPNPTNFKLTVEGDFKESLDFELFTVLGERVIAGQLSGSGQQIDLSDLPANVYFLKVDNRTYRVVKVR